MSLEAVGTGVHELLKQAESDVCEELKVKVSVSVKDSYYPCKHLSDHFC